MLHAERFWQLKDKKFKKYFNNGAISMRLMPCSTNLGVWVQQSQYGGVYICEK